MFSILFLMYNIFIYNNEFLREKLSENNHKKIDEHDDDKFHKRRNVNKVQYEDEENLCSVLVFGLPSFYFLSYFILYHELQGLPSLISN